MKRREFVPALGAGLGWWLYPQVALGAVWTPQFTVNPPYLAQEKFAMPGADEFPEEKLAMETASAWKQAIESGGIEIGDRFEGSPIGALRYVAVGEDAERAQFSTAKMEASAWKQGWQEWRASLGELRAVRTFLLPGDLLRYEIASTVAGRLEYRVGTWKQRWEQGRLVEFSPIAETRAHAARPWFSEVTEHALGESPAFREHLAKGIPYWRSRLDPATGIDVYGNCGVACGDIDGDGMDEIYVSQPGGLPNRLFKIGPDGKWTDVSAQWGVDVLDDTTCALFIDVNNDGRQDMVVLLASAGPQLFVNRGQGRLEHQANAFQFANKAQGSFTGMAAADYDRDGFIDIYACCYSLYQSEAQYRYPVPYHDAQNGPPNFLFRNRGGDGLLRFDDATESAGLNQNNNRYSFAPAWCDYDGSGWPSLYVANDFGRNNLYVNKDGHFVDQAKAHAVEDIGPGMSAAWFDYHGDGRPDLYVSNMWSDVGQRVVASGRLGLDTEELRTAYRGHTRGNSLYRNGDAGFVDVSAGQGVGLGRWAWSSDGHDFDGDGTPETYVTCGMITNESHNDLMSYFWRQVVAKSPKTFMPNASYEAGWNAINQFIREDYSWNGHEPNVLYAKRGGASIDVSGISGADWAEDSRSFAVTDFDGDGVPDLVLKSRLGPQVRVLQNTRWLGAVLVVELVGTRSNRDAIGAKVDVDGQVKWVTAGSGYLGQHSKWLSFAMQSRARAQRVTVTWPSGVVERWEALESGFRHQLTEGSRELKKTALKERSLMPAGAVTAVDNRSLLHEAWLMEPVPLPERRDGPALVLVKDGAVEVPDVACHVVDIAASSKDVGNAYAIFRRYLFDYRAPLDLPLGLLIDGQSRVVKVYATVPSSADVKRDLDMLRSGQSVRAAGVFEGGRFFAPRRDLYKFGAAFLQVGLLKQALPYLEAASKREPENDRMLLTLGQVYARSGRRAEAKVSLENVTQRAPGLAEGWNELGGIAYEEGDYLKAAQLYAKALSIQPDLPYALLNAAQTNTRLAKAEVAEKQYRRVLELDASNAEAHNGLGLLLSKSGRGGEALAEFKQAIALKRDFAGAINNIGVLYMQLGQPNDALAAFEYGIEVAPQEDVLYLNLARVHARSGETMKARAALERLLTVKPGNATATRALRELEARP